MKFFFLFLIIIANDKIAITQSLISGFNENKYLFQKPPIDTGIFRIWTYVEESSAISNDGEYALYTVRDHYNKSAKLIIHPIKGAAEIELLDVHEYTFTEDSRMVISLKNKDSLCLVNLSSSLIENIANVSSFRLFKKKDTEYLSYLLNSKDKKLIIRDLKTGKEQYYLGVTDYLLNKEGSTLIIKLESKRDTTSAQSLECVDLISGNRKLIWLGASTAGNLIFDDLGSQLVFMVQGNDSNKYEKTLWYYKVGTKTAVELANNKLRGINNALQLDGISRFTKDGEKLFINFKAPLPKINSEIVNVDVWSYTDPKVQSQQLEDCQFYGPKNSLVFFNIKDKRVVWSQDKEGESVITLDNSDNIALLDSSKGEPSEWNWNKTSQPSFYIVYLTTGEKQPIPFNKPILSPSQKYIIGYDKNYTDVLIYDIATKVIRNLTKSLPTYLDFEDNDQPFLINRRGVYIANWVIDDKAVMIYDKYDIWMLDPLEKKAPVNLTNGLGKQSETMFRLSSGLFNPPISNNIEFLVIAFNQKTKENGFYKISLLRQKGNPELLSMSPYLFYYFNKEILGITPIKARDKDIYLVQRQSANESPNLFWTKDFKSFNALSNVYPEKKFNWLKSELVTFKTESGDLEQGILYKPENFDPQRKYPIIFNYYDKGSYKLNSYPNPGGENGSLDIGWFVSHEYIVFIPDIHYKIGEPGSSALNSVLGAAKHFATENWIDSTKMGLQGHSFGGYETNYIVTHTNLFSAACSSSGMSDLVSSYLGLVAEHSNYDWYENRFCRIGNTLWERPDLYIKNSPIFNVDKITTPLLTVANKNDHNVYFNQGLELFMALRRLGKRTWMLQYDGQNHGVSGTARTDFLIRMTQFFDHYLKNAPAPKWMLDGISAKMKGINMGYELDDSGRTPGQGLSKRNNEIEY